MTTPEKLKARQLKLLEEQHKITKRLRIESGLVGFLMVVVAASTIYSGQKDQAQDECFSRNFAALSDAAQTRGDLVQRESDAVAKVLKTAARDRSDTVAIDEALDEYEEKQKQITKERKANPIPPFPTGKCD